jgi:hypothetical protein
LTLAKNHHGNGNSSRHEGCAQDEMLLVAIGCVLLGTPKRLQCCCTGACALHHAESKLLIGADIRHITLHG